MSACDDDVICDVDSNNPPEHIFRNDESSFIADECFESSEVNFAKDECFKGDEPFAQSHVMRPMRPFRYQGPMQFRSGPGSRPPYQMGFRGQRVPMHMTGSNHGAPFIRPGMGQNRNNSPYENYGPAVGMPRGPPRHMQHFQHRYPPVNENRNEEDVDESMQPYRDMNSSCGEFDMPPPSSNGYQNVPSGMRVRAPPPFMVGPHGVPHTSAQQHSGPQIPGPQFNAPPNQPFPGPPTQSFASPPFNNQNQHMGAPFNSPNAYGGATSNRQFAGPSAPPFSGPPSIHGGPPAGPCNQNFSGPPPGTNINVPPNPQEFSGQNFGQFNSPHFPAQPRPPFAPTTVGMPAPVPSAVPPTNAPLQPTPVPPMPHPGILSPAVPGATSSLPACGNQTSGAPPVMPRLSNPSESAPNMFPNAPMPPFPVARPPFGLATPPVPSPVPVTPVSTNPPTQAPLIAQTPVSHTPPNGPPAFPYATSENVSSVPVSQYSTMPTFPTPVATRPVLAQPPMPPQPNMQFHMMPPPMSSIPPSMPPFRPPMTFMPPALPMGAMTPLPTPVITQKTPDDIWVENLTAEGKSYYYNMRTRETRWDRPEGVPVVRQGEVDVTAKPTNTQPLLPTVPQMFRKPLDVAAWTEYHNPEGKAYYHNSKTSETTWEKPKILMDWEELQNKATPVQHATPQSEATVDAVKSQFSSPLIDSKVSQAVAVTEPSLTPTLNVEAKNEVEEPEFKDKASEVVVSNESKEKKPQKDNSRPVSSTAVPGTPWCVVWTGDDRAFFFNPSQRLSVWEKPEELKDRVDVDRLLEKRPVPTSEATSSEDDKAVERERNMDTGESAVKKPRLEEERETVSKEENVLANGIADAMDTETDKGNSAPDKIPVGLEAAREAEERAARERAVQPLEVRVRRFREMLVEMQVSAFSTWEKELHKIVFDPRYLLLASKERKQTFEAYVKERAEEERREKKNKIKERKEKYTELLEEAGLSSKSSFSDFSTKYAKDERFRNIEKAREREAIFQDFISELRKREKDEKHREKEKVKSDFISLLKEQKSLSRHSHWNDVKRKLDSDPRYKAVDSSSRREDWFREFAKRLDDTREDSDSRREREKRERQEASIREREREVKEALSSSLREREKEREQQLHSEQEQNFRSMLTELVRDSALSWKESKKILRKDDRWELVSDVLQRAERDSIFKDHMSNLHKKSRETKSQNDSEGRERRSEIDDLERRSSKDSGRR